MSTLTSRLIVELVDRATAPARALQATIGRLNAVQMANTQRLNELRGRMIDAAGVGYLLARSIAAPLRAGTEFETMLEDIGQKIDLPVSQLPKLGQEIRAIGRDTTQSATAIAQGLDVLTGMGATREDALGLMPTIGRAATAYNAEIADLAQAGYAALDNLKVPAEQFAGALDAMAQAGKSGAFELKDMAQYFPQLGAGYQALGQTGVTAVADLAAALQIVRKGTGDSASAATNLNNVLQKMRAPQTVAAFKKMGVNLEKELKKAAARGLTPIEAIAEITAKSLKGDLSKIGYLFPDAQVQQGLRPLIQNIEEYRRIRSEAMAAQGVVESDYQRRLMTGAKAAERWRIALENINLAIGAALLPALASLGERFVPIINRLADLAEAYPAVTRAIVATTAALVALRVAAIAAQFAFFWMRGGVITAAIMGLRGLSLAAWAVTLPFVALAGLGRFGAAAFLALLNPIKLVQAALVALRIAVISTGIGALLVGIALAGAWIYQNWTGIGIAFEAFSGAFMRAIEPVMPTLQPVLDGISWLYDLVSSILVPIDAMGGGWAQASIAAGTFAGGVVVAMTELPAKIGAALTAGWTAVVAWFDSAKQSVTTFLSELATLLSGSESAWHEVGFAIGEAFGTALRRVAEIGQTLIRDIVAAIANGAPLVLAELQRLGTSIISTIASIDLAAAGRAIMESLLAGLKAGAQAVLGYAAEIGRGIKDSVSGALSGAWEGVKSGLGLGPSPAVKALQERARGGPVSAGQTYLVGERGPELVTFDQSGWVHDAARTTRMLRSIAAASAVAIPSSPSFAMPAPPASMVEAPQASAAGPSPARGPVEINLGGVTFQITAAPGQSPEAIADAVERKLSAKLTELSNRAFHDGVYS